MKFKKFVLLIMTLMCIIGGTLVVNANENTVQTNHNEPAETIIVNGYTYIRDNCINGKDVVVCDNDYFSKSEIRVNDHTYYRCKGNMDVLSDYVVPVVGIAGIIFIVIVLYVESYKYEHC